MSQNINYRDIQMYLNAIAGNALGDMDNSPHARFWQIPYDSFINGNVPNTKCNAQDIPLINKNDPINSAFLLILKSTWCNKRQMPDGGPLITEVDYAVTLEDGTIISGQQIQDNIASWLVNGFPEN